MRNPTGDFVIRSALGHLYSVSDHFKDRGVFPVFDLDWFPSYLMMRRTDQVGRKTKVISSLASNAEAFIQYLAKVKQLKGTGEWVKEVIEFEMKKERD